MTLFESIPAMLRILIVFVAILVLIRRKVSLGTAFMAGAMCLGLLFGQGALAIVRSVLQGLFQPKTFSLAVAVTLILVLSHSLEAANQMQRLLEHFQGLLRHAGLNLVVFPALIGLLPMPGGAIFSAPMVKNIGQRHALSGDRLSFINYWYRHIWEYWWPLYPGVLLTTTLAGLDLWPFVISMVPMTVVAVGSGCAPLRGLTRDRRSPHQQVDDGFGHRLRPFLRELAPIMIVIVLGLGLGTGLTPILKPLGLNIAKELGLIVALLISIGWVWKINRLPNAQRHRILARKELRQMFYMVAAILVFKQILQDSRAVDAVSAELLYLQIPLISITILLPMIVGLVCGITIAFVGSTFPILISLIQSFGEGQYMLAYMMLALTSGFIGVLFSPLHVCLMLSNAYFETGMKAVYRHLWLPCAAILVVGCIYFCILRFIPGSIA